MTLIEAGPRILPALPEKLAAAAQGELRGARRARADQYARDRGDARRRSSTGNGERIESELRVWAAGVKGAGGARSYRRARDQPEQPAAGEADARRPRSTTASSRWAIAAPVWIQRPAVRCHRAPRRRTRWRRPCSTILVRLMNGRPLKPFEYHDHGSLVSISRFSTVGSLMGNLVGGRMAIEGRLARFVYVSLYRMHLIAIRWLVARRRADRDRPGQHDRAAEAEAALAAAANGYSRDRANACARHLREING